jgi:hypothetical protein
MVIAARKVIIILKDHGYESASFYQVINVLMNSSQTTAITLENNDHVNTLPDNAKGRIFLTSVVYVTIAS